ncbi:MAG: SAM-dependent methyltransferase [Pseudomonas sp.]|nr:MAG: SAM-dependent methyltransferase [Pseudomonas sp.]
MHPNDTPLTGSDLLQRFQALDGFLLDTQALWRPKPFTMRELPWESDHPELAAWLRSRSLDDAEAAHNTPELLPAPAPFPALADTAARLACIGQLPAHAFAALPHPLTVDVPGRKLQQIEAFASRLTFTQPPRHWLDWCAGKGHLGRALAQDGTPLLSLELDPQLVQDGQHMSDRLGLRAQHRQQDVLATDASEHLHPEHTAIALHACGDLHVRLLQLASARRCRQLAVAPCCYNRIDSEHYRPLSRAAKASRLSLSRDDLRLPQAETVTAGARVRRQRDTSMAWRLGFDLLQREARHCDDYLPIPAVSPTWLNKPFADYCRNLATLKGLDLAATIDWPQWEALGWQRLAQVRNLELVRGLFRRPMELWLLLDRALFLEEQGYRATLGAFCATRMTPRNLLLLAERI